MKTIIALLFSIFFYLQLPAQCSYLAYEYFGAAPIAPLNYSYSGQGWGAAWFIQSDDSIIPGYQIENTTPLSYGTLQTAGNYASGGSFYRRAGRRLNVNAAGPFAAYLSGGQIGLAGTTLYTSILLRKEENNNEEIYFSLNNSNITWCTGCASAEVAIGYFGVASDVGGQMRWSLRINGVVYPTSEAVVAGADALLVLQTDFNATTDMHLFVNPASLAGPAPAPTMTQSTGAAISFNNTSLYLGEDFNSGAADEIRFTTGYDCATIDNTLTANVPPIADFTTSPSSGTAPLLVTLDGSLSNDPDGTIVDYEWNFGDGSATVTGNPVNHTYSIFGILTVSLTVTDDNGVQNTAFQTITVYDSNGEFPCQSTLNLNSAADCTTNTGGDLTVNLGLGDALTLLDGGVPISPTTGTQFTGLNTGTYQLEITGANNCRDTWEVHIPVDSTSCPGWSKSVCDMRVGVNLADLADWEVERSMRNLMKHVRGNRPTFTAACGCWSLSVENEITLDANGYPTELPQNTSAGVTMMRQMISSNGGNLQTGRRYVLLYDGVGTLQIQGNAAVINQSAGRIEFEPTAAANLWIDMFASQLGNHVRNMRLLRIEDEFTDLNAKPFYDGFLHKLMPFDALRFMDWARTNNHPISDWGDRSQQSYYTYATDEGVPLELIVELSNTVQKDVWICVPHLADDNYIAEMARLFRDNLDPNLTIYLEYSNEVWNWMFAQAHYNNNNRPSNIGYGRAYSVKSKNVFDIWYNEFGLAAPTRIRRVIGLQGTNNYINREILSQLDQSDWDYASPTWYFGVDHGGTGNPVLNAASTGQDVIDNARYAWQNYTRPLIYQDYLNTFVMGKGIINYEGGQHFSNFTNPPHLQALIDAHVEPDIYNLYDEVMDEIRDWGSELPVLFTLGGRQANPDRAIIFGHLDHIDVEPPYMTTAPKYQAVLDNMCQVSLDPKVMLQGPYDTGTALMEVDLNVNSLIPLSEPYTDLPNQNHTYKGGFEVMTSAAQALTGNDAIVDWVMVELRDKNNSSTVLASRAALLQADGDVVDTDGTSAVNFIGIAPDDYFVAVRHRNHLGVMTAVAVGLN